MPGRSGMDSGGSNRRKRMRRERCCQMDARVFCTGWGQRSGEVSGSGFGPRHGLRRGLTDKLTGIK